MRGPLSSVPKRLGNFVTSFDTTRPSPPNEPLFFSNSRSACNLRPCFLAASSPLLLSRLVETHFSLFLFFIFFLTAHRIQNLYHYEYIYIYKNRALISRITVEECSKKNLRDEDRDRISLRAAKSSGLILGSKLYNSLPGISCAKEFHPRDNYPWPRKWRLSPKRTRTRRTPVLRILGRRLPSIRLGVITEPTLAACTCTRPAWKMSGMRPRLSAHAATSQTSRLFPRIDTRAEGRERKEAMIEIDSVSSITAHSIKATYPIFPP